jgi:spore coat polysaccharide biosynthesis protein SpsF (cytidylyltransferase family)
MEQVKVIAITQARVGSTRLPRKVLLPLGNDTLLGIHLARLSQANSVDQCIVATTNEEESETIVKLAEAKGISTFQGSLNDVLDRFYQAALPYQPSHIVRITSDCPLIDPNLIDKVVEEAISGGYDYYANILVEDFPDGQDVEVFTFEALERAWNEATTNTEREHVTPYIRNNSSFKGGTLFKSADYQAPENFNHVRMTVDEAIDLEVMQWLVSELGTDKDWLLYTKHMLANQDKLANARIQRNEGYLKSLEKESE